MRTFSVSRFLWPFACLPAIAALMLFWPATSKAGEIDIQADDVHYDAEQQNYIAVGDVVVSRNGSVLLAERIRYDQNTGIIHATGNVQLQTPDGSVLHSDEMRVDDTLVRENLSNFRAKTSGGARIAASTLTKTDETARHFEHFVYTPCIPCKDDPALPPTWQVKASEAEHNLESKDYILRNAVIELGGWPVFYTPYFSHPDATVKRRTGFLQPTYGQTESLGQYLITPYFVDIALDKNLLITPTATEDGGNVVAMDYTQAFDTGTLSAKASYGEVELLKDQGKDPAGHYEVQLSMQPQKHIQLGARIRHVSNPGYLSKLPVSSSRFGDLYNSHAYWRQYGADNPRNRIEAKAVSYRDHRSSVDVDKAPFLVPEVGGQYYAKTDSYGGRFRYDFSVRHIQQEDIANTQSLSIGTDYKIGQILPYGIIADYHAGIEGSLFRYQSDKAGLKSDSHAQLYPRLHGSWRLPYQRSFDDAVGVFEPIASFSLSPFSVNDGDLPNQDSGVLVSNETLLFSSEKISGKTRRDDSTRLSLAVEYNHYWETGTIASLLLGRNFEFRAASLSNKDIAMKRFEERDDDYIMRARLRHTNGMFFENRTTFDNDRHRINSHELETSWANMLPGFSPTLNYIVQRKDTERKLEGTHQFTAGFTQEIGEFWSLTGKTHYDLDNAQDKFRNGSLRLVYDDECLKIFGFYKRDKSKSQYTEEEQIWGMTLQLKFGA